MTKRKWIAIIIVCTVVFAGTIGGVVAYMIKISQEKKGDFVPAAVSCTINEGFANNQSLILPLRTRVTSMCMFAFEWLRIG